MLYVYTYMYVICVHAHVQNAYTKYYKSVSMLHTVIIVTTILVFP